MNKHNHATQLHHQEYISNPFKVVEKVMKSLFANVGMLAAHFGIGVAVFMAFAAIVAFSFVAVLIGGEDFIFVPIIVALLLVFPFVYCMNWLTLAQTKLALAVSDGVTIDFKTLFKHDSKKIFGLMGLFILTGLAVLGGILLLIIPGILLAIFFSYAPFIYVKENISVVDAMGKSFSLVKDSFVELLGVGSVFFIYHGVSATLANIPLVGLLFSMVLFPIDIFVSYLVAASNAYRYRSISDVHAAGLARPKLDPINYILVIILAGLVVLAGMLLVGFIALLLANPEFLRETSSY